MPKRQINRLSSNTLLISTMLLFVGCADFQQRYSYEQDNSEWLTIHSLIADHDHDGVKDYGDLCPSKADSHWVDSLGCDRNRPLTTTPPLSAHVQCSLPHLGSAK